MSFWVFIKYKFVFNFFIYKFIFADKFSYFAYQFLCMKQVFLIILPRK